MQSANMFSIKTDQEKTVTSPTWVAHATQGKLLTFILETEERKSHTSTEWLMLNYWISCPLKCKQGPLWQGRNNQNKKHHAQHISPRDFLRHQMHMSLQCTTRFIYRQWESLPTGTYHCLCLYPGPEGSKGSHQPRPPSLGTPPPCLWSRTPFQPSPEHQSLPMAHGAAPSAPGCFRRPQINRPSRQQGFWASKAETIITETTEGT